MPKLVLVWLSLTLLACAGDKTPIALTATAELRDEGKDTEALVVTLVTEPKVSIWCRDCKQTPAGMSVDASGRLVLTLATKDEGPPQKHCFFGAIGGTERRSADVCVDGPKLKPGLEVTSGEFSCKRVKCEGKIFLGHLEVGDFEPGATLTVRGQKIETTKGTEIDLQFAKLAADLTLADVATNKQVADVPFAITFADGQKESGALTITAGAVFAKVDRLSAIDQGPVAFGDEPASPSPAKPRGIAYLPVGSAFKLEENVYGTPAKLVELDQIVKATRTNRIVQRCPYRLETGETTEIVRLVADIEATVYDRRTGNTIRTKTFSAPTPEACPAKFTTTAADAREGFGFSTYAKDDDVIAWVKTLL